MKFKLLPLFFILFITATAQQELKVTVSDPMQFKKYENFSSVLGEHNGYIFIRHYNLLKNYIDKYDAVTLTKVASYKVGRNELGGCMFLHNGIITIISSAKNTFKAKFLTTDFKKAKESRKLLKAMNSISYSGTQLIEGEDNIVLGTFAFKMKKCKYKVKCFNMDMEEVYSREMELDVDAEEMDLTTTASGNYLIISLSDKKNTKGKPTYYVLDMGDKNSKPVKVNVENEDHDGEILLYYLTAKDKNTLVYMGNIDEKNDDDDKEKRICMGMIDPETGEQECMDENENITFFRSLQGSLFCVKDWTTMPGKDANGKVPDEEKIKLENIVISVVEDECTTDETVIERKGKLKYELDEATKQAINFWGIPDNTFAATIFTNDKQVIVVYPDVPEGKTTSDFDMKVAVFIPETKDLKTYTIDMPEGLEKLFTPARARIAGKHLCFILNGVENTYLAKVEIPE